jgi:hypothetical protein
LEEVGLLGASEADPREPSRIPKWLAPYRPDLGSIRPYHPPDTKIVETQAHIYRFDPFSPTHVSCLKRAILRALGDGNQVTFLVHPHLRLYEPFFGERSTESGLRETLRFLVIDKGSVIWNTTHSSLTEYWEMVLCPEHRKVKAEVQRGHILVTNESDVMVSGVPVEALFDNGKRCLLVTEVPPNDCVEIDPKCGNPGGG